MHKVCASIGSVPFEVKNPGTYCLERSLELGSESRSPFAIVAPSDTTIDLKGFTLQGPGKGVGVFGNNVQRLNVRNGTIKGFGVGVLVVAMKPSPIPARNVIENLHLQSNTTAGLWIAGTDTIVRNSRISKSGGGELAIEGFEPFRDAYGLRIRGPGAIIAGNTITGTHSSRGARSIGIEITDGRESEIRDNTIIGDGRGVGLSIPDQTVVKVTGNQISQVRRAIVLNRVGQEPIDRRRMTTGGSAIIEGNEIKEIKQSRITIAAGRNHIQLPVHNGHKDWVTAVAWSPDGMSVAFGTRLGFVQIYDVTNLEKLVELASPGKSMRMEEPFSLTERRGLRPDGLIIPEGCWGGVCALAYTPDSRYLAAGSDDGLLRLWSVKTGSVIRLFSGHRDTIRSIAISPNGKLLASTGDDHATRIWEVKTGKLLHAMKWGIKTEKWPRRLPILTQDVLFSPDGKTIAVGGSGGVQFRDIRDGRLVAEINSKMAEESGIAGASAVRANVLFGSRIAYSPNGQKLAFRVGQGKTGLWNVHRNVIEGFLDSGQANSKNHVDMKYVFSPDGKLLVAGGDHGALSLWSLQHGREERLLYDRPSEVHVDNIAFSPDGKQLVSCEWNQGYLGASIKDPEARIRIWNMSTKTEILPDVTQLSRD